MAVITGAAGNIVAYMINGEVDTLQAWAKRIFRPSRGSDEPAQVRAITNDCAALAEDGMSELEVKIRWKAILETYLAEHPEILPEIEALASSAPSRAGEMYVGTQRNESGVFVGRDNYGQISRSRES
ncbi:hypothetical protein [Micromonospora sp. 067-2]|uniref:hypothetical protein n=1 Tax=Micromonospora sp. 067-2 TaxID=2789270 RepID=UPI00397B56B3